MEVKRTLFPLGKMTQTLGVTFDQSRAAKEILKFTLNANVQPVVTEPGEGEVLTLTISSEKVSDVLDDTVEPENQIIPIGDTASNTYFGLPRGAQSIEYCIMVARAHLVVRSRVVEIEFETTNIDKVISASLRKNATIVDPRIPGGGASGKIIGYTLALDGDTGDFSGSIKIGSAVGYGGAVVEAAGTDDYADDYSSEYTFLVGQQNVLPLGDVGYIVPDTTVAALSWLGQLSWHDVIEEGLTVENPPAAQKAVIDAGGTSSASSIKRSRINSPTPRRKRNRLPTRSRRSRPSCGSRWYRLTTRLALTSISWFLIWSCRRTSILRRPENGKP